MKNKVYTLEEYNKKYRHRRARLLKITKNQLADYQKKYPDAVKDYLLKNKKWTLIGDTYYQIPRFPSFTWFRNLHLAVQIGTYVLGAGAIAGITIGVLYGIQPKIEYITYTLDPDIELKKVQHDIQIVNDSKYPGVSIAHKNTNNAEFRVQAFTDLHLDHNRDTCSYTFSMLARNIMKYQPDLVVFCGDNITSSYNAPRTRQFAQLLEDLGVYWCATLGNHEKNKSNPHCIERDEMIGIWTDKEKYPHCLIDKTEKKTEDGATVWGKGNTLINLVSDAGVTQSLYFLDSGTELTDDQMKEFAPEIQLYIQMGKAKATETEFYDYIKGSQVSWYKETFTKTRTILNKEGKATPHSTIFSHVPLVEQEDGYLKLFNDWEIDTRKEKSTVNKIRAFTDYPQNSGEHATYYAKSIDDLYNETTGYLQGKRNRRTEGVCYSPHDLRYQQAGVSTPILEAMQSFGNNNAFFCGHDHSNNYTIKWKGQFLGYINSGCYSSNNLYTRGLLGANPEKPDVEPKYGGHLSQGFTDLVYKDTVNSESNILNKVEIVESYNYFKQDKPELYMKGLKLVKDQLLTGKKRTYSDKRADYLDGR